MMPETTARNEALPAEPRQEAHLAADPQETLPAPRSWVGRLVVWTERHPRVPLLLTLALALLGRILLIVRTHAMIDGDEALVGIQAERILQGQHPVYFYGQAYMGNLEAYLAAALFRLLGPSSWALRAVPLLLALLLVYLTWRLARALLPVEAPTTPLLAGLAALLAAVPPLYDAVAELRTWGGQIEVYVITVALLLVTVELRRRLRAGAGASELAWRWGLWGFLAGLGIWINPLTAYALAACVLWLLLPLVVRGAPRLYTLLPFVRRAASVEQQSSPPPSQGRRGPPLGAGVPQWGLGWAWGTLAVVPGLAVGGLPAWLYALQNGATNLLVYVQQPTVDPVVSGAARHGRLFLGAAITARYATCVAPRTLDGALPGESLLLLPLRALLLVPALLALACALALVVRHRRQSIRTGLPLLYAGVVSVVFCLGTSAWASTKACDADLAGRYAVPLALVLPTLLLALFVAPALWSTLRVRRGRSQLSSAGLRRGWSAVLLGLLLLPAAQLVTYGLADPTATFQSPYYRHIGLDTQPLLDYLTAHNIHAAWANHWIGNIVTFETDGKTICADYYDQVYHSGIRRPPGTLETVFAADRPSFILISTDPHPALAAALDGRGVAYTLAVLPASNVTVITPAVTVNPADVVAALGADYV
jgi:hypothetical protein